MIFSYIYVQAPKRKITTPYPRVSTDPETRLISNDTGTMFAFELTEIKNIVLQL
jgi:hypothetical protein